MMTGSGGGGNNKWTDEQEWERKKARQRAMMARGKGLDARELGNGALGVSGIGSYAQQQASQGTAAQPTYPTPADLPKYNNLAEKQQGQRDAFANIQKPGFGLGYSVKPSVPQKPIDDMRGQGVATPNASTAPSPIDDIQPTYQDSESNNGISKGDGGGKRPGLSIDNNAAVAQPLAPQMGGGNSARGFGVMAAPRKAYGEDSRRAVIRMDIKPYKGMNGRLTTGQIALNDAIRKGDDEKYENQRYGVQMGMAQELAQEGMQQAGANSRAQLTESGANSRADNQLGFDAEKFQQMAALDKRKLDMQQSNDDVSNFAPKRLNGLYEKYDAAESDEDRSAIASQIQSLSGTSKPQSPVLVNNTGQTATGDSMAPLKDNAAMLYLPDSREWVQPPTAERTSNDTPMLAIQQSGKFTKEQKGEIYDIYMAGGDISGYLE